MDFRFVLHVLLSWFSIYRFEIDLLWIKSIWMDLIHNKSSSSRKIQNQLIMYRKVIENPYIRISIRRLKSKKRAKILGSRFAEAVPPAESLKAIKKALTLPKDMISKGFEVKSQVAAGDLV